MLTGILLSAGLSRRFGSPKALARLPTGETVVEHLQKTLLQTDLSEIIVVLGAEADQVKLSLLKHRKFKFVYNKDHNLGQTSSFKAGLKEISPDAEGILLFPVDCPFVRAETVEAVIGAFSDPPSSSLIVIPSLEGKKGHPPLFSMRLREEFSGLDNACGLNTVAHAYQDQTRILPVEDAGIIQSFNTREEFETILAQQPTR